MISLKEYTTGDIVHSNLRWTISKGVRLKDNKPVFIKTLSVDNPANSDLKRFQHDYEIGRSLDHENVLSYLDLVPSAGGFAIITEDFSSQALSFLLKQNAFTHQSFLSFAIQIASALDCIHRQKIIHSDINPASILFNPAKDIAKIVDFSLAYQLNWETDFESSPYDISGSLSFISPEQTGRINRPVDIRSDFYSLGVTFYYLLTGKLPFEHTDPARLIHAHIAQYPVTPKNLNDSIPDALSDIVMKLMSKDVEDRYQSASGLMADLEKSNNCYHSTGRVESFKLGERDLLPRLRLSHKIYGRDENLADVVKAFETLDQNKTHTHFISGAPGIGKTQFLRELRRVLSLKRARIISGNYESNRSGVPFLGIIQALRRGIKTILTESDQNLETWRRRFLNALDNNIQVVADLIPEIVSVVGKVNIPDQLEADEIKNRFPFTLLELVKTLCQPSMPLVIIIDNLHLADAASFRLLEIVLTDSSLSHLMLVAAYGSEVPESSKDVEEFIGKIGRENVTVHHTSLEGLTSRQVTDFVNDSFRCGFEKAHGLAAVVTPKTAGNPHYIARFLMQMYQENRIFWQDDENDIQEWSFDLCTIRKQGATDNVIDFLESKLADLDLDEKKMLAAASCIGMDFTIDILQELLNKQEKEISRKLNHLVREGILLAIDPGAINFGMSYRFAHPRLKKAFDVFEDESSRQKIHYNIGKYLWERHYQNFNAETLFQTVQHLNEGRALIKSKEELSRLMRLNYQAGIRAKQANVHESAVVFFETGIDLLDELETTVKDENLFSLQIELADAYYMLSTFDKMERIIKALGDQSLSQQQQVVVSELQINAFMARNMMAQALELSLESLKKIGFSFPCNPGKSRLTKELMHTKWALARVNLKDLKTLPEIKDKHKILILRLVRKSLMSAYVVNPHLFILIILKMMRYTLKWGVSEECIFFTYYGSIVCSIHQDFDLGYQFGSLGIQMTDRFPNCKNRAPNIHVFEALIRFWKEPLKNSIPGLLEAYKLGLETGYMETAVNSLYSSSMAAFFGAEFLVDVEKSIEKHFQRIRQHQHRAAILICSFQRQMVLNLLGRSDDPCKLENPYFRESDIVAKYNRDNDINGLTHYYGCKIFLYFLFGRYDTAVNSVKSFQPRMEKSIGFLTHALINFYYALSVLAIFEAQPAKEKKSFLKELDFILALFKKMSTACPVNYLNKYFLLKAEFSRVRVAGDASDLYRLAIDLSGESGLVYEQAIANERFAGYWIQRNEPKIAELFLLEAHSLYSRWGAVAKTKEMENAYPEFLKQQPNIYTASQYTSDFPQITSTQQVDFQAILDAIRKVSGEIITKRLLSSILKLVIEHSGAEKGFLITKKDKELVIEEAATSRKDGIVSVYEPVLNSSKTRFCEAIVSFVFRSGETILFDNTYKHSPFTGDEYIKRNKTKSLLCAPFQLRNYTYGVIYLENNLSESVFTNNRVEFIRTILAQASVSMENARLYEKTISTQKKLIKSEEKYKILVENTGALVMHLSLGSVVLFINSFGAAYFKLEAFELIGKDVRGYSDFFHTKLKDRIRSLVKTGEGATFEDYIDLPAGEFWFISNYQSVKDDHGNTVAIQVTAQNITEYKAAEEELKRLSTILEATSDFVGIFLPDMNVQYINSAGKRMIGLDDAVNLVNLEFERFHPKWAMQIVRNEGIPGAINNGTWSGETALLNADGTEIPASQVIMAHISISGKLQFISTIARDISEQKDNEKRLTEYQETLEKMVSERTSELKLVQGQLIEKAHKAGVADIASGTLHNVGNLLNSIKTSASAIDEVVEHSNLMGFAQANNLLKQNMDNLAEFVAAGAKGETLMQYYLKLEESLFEENRTIQTEIKRLNEKIDIISDVIAAQQTYAGNDSITEDYSLVTVVEDALTLEAGLIDRYGISIARQYEDVPMIPIQKTKLIHVLINLINNARDAMLHLPADSRVLTFTIKMDDDFVYLLTKDSGKGIPEENLDKIFTHGFTTKKEGHGFGLHSSASFIKEMNGKIWVESEGEGKGTTFIIQLPIVNMDFTK